MEGFHQEPLEFTKHGLARKTQRGLAQGDVEFIIRYGTGVGDGAYLLTNKDVSWLIVQCKRKVVKLQHWLAEGHGEELERGFRVLLKECRVEIRQAERLRNVKVVVAGKYIVTGYAATPRAQKRSLRYSKTSGFGYGPQPG